MRVLVVEDDADLRNSVGAALRRSGLAVDVCERLVDADSAIAASDYDCVVLDRGLPDGDGLEALQRWRLDANTVPVLFLTARDQVQDRVMGFEAGGDDYVVKPFSLEELVARVRSLCRRSVLVQPSLLERCGVCIDRGRAEVRREGVLLPLTTKEFAILEVLMVNAPTVVSRSALIEHCWDDATDPMSNVVDVHVASLRRKLGAPVVIRTVRGSGFVFEPADDPNPAEGTEQ